MADNLYDYLNRFNLGQLGAAGNRFLQGAANTLNRYGVGQPGGVTFLRPATGKQKLEQAWGTIPDRLNSPQGGGFGYMFGRQPNYSDAQGNIYDAVSGRLLYGVKPRTGSGSGSTGGGSLGGGSPAAERAYQAEASRVAQLTAQDPELQRYEKARQLAVAPGATPQQVQSAEDIGMQMWAQKYGKTLAPKVKPGQAGYDVIQKTLYPGGAPLPALPAESIAMLDEIAPANDMGIRPDITPMPGALPVFSDASDAMYQAVMGGPSTLVPPAPQLPSPSAASPQQTGGISFQDASFETPATKRRSDLFAQLLSGIRQYGGTP